MLHDLRFGFRMLRRSPSFSLLAILCLTLGIGATTAVFSWMEGILLRPFPLVANQDRMVAVTSLAQGQRGNVSWLDFQDFVKNCKLLETGIVDRIMGTTLSIGDRAERATGSVVSANYFDALGVRPVLGRGFMPDEERGRNAHPVTVISYLAWQDRYKGDPNIIGRTQILNGVQHTIIGVAPEGFYGTFVGYKFSFWVPASMEELFDGGGYKLENRGERWIEGFFVLKPGVSVAQAQAEASAVAKRLEADYPATNRGREVRLYNLWATPFNGAGTLLPTLRIAMVVAAFVLLIACANVGNLLLVRSFARRHEMTVRLSIGAGRARLLKQLLTEGLILAVLAAAGGFLVANWGRSLILLMYPARPGVLVNLPAEFDWRVLALSAVVCLFSTVLFGLVPALQASNVDLAVAMRSETGSVVGGRNRAWIRSGLVLVQVSLSFVLLVGTGLLLKGLVSMREMNPGFSTSGVLASYVDMTAAGYDSARIRDFQDRLIDRLQSLPGVESVSMARITPFSYGSYRSSPIAVDGFVTTPEDQPVVDYNEVTPGYLATLGIPLVSGREFTRQDNESAAPVVVVNDAMVQQFWKGQDPIGKRVQVKGRWLQVVGVAKLSKYARLTETPRAFMYLPVRQTTSNAQNFQIRTRLGPETMSKVLTREIQALDPNLAPGEVITMREHVDRMSWQQRAAVMLLAIFGGMALLLAAIGLYGVMSYAVSQSTRELGLRMALGASPQQLLKLVMSKGVVLTAAGIVVGAVVALGLTRLLGDMLYQVSPRDPATFGIALVVMAVAAVAACLIPAWRASRTDPLEALRS